MTLPSRNPCNQYTFRLHAKLSQMMIQVSVHQFVPILKTHLSPKRMMHYRNDRSSFGKFLNTSYKLCLAFSKSEWEVIRNSFAVGLFFPKSLLKALFFNNRPSKRIGKLIVKSCFPNATFMAAIQCSHI